MAPSIGETRAGFVSLVPNKASVYTRKTIPRNEEKWITVLSDPKRGSDWQSLFPRLSQPCYVTSIKTIENLMDRDIGKQLNPYCRESLNEMESKISMTKCGCKRSLKAALRKGLRSVKTKMGFDVIHERFKGILEVFQANHNWWVMAKFHKIGRNTYTTDDFHGTLSPFWEKDCFQEERRKTKPVKQSF